MNERSTHTNVSGLVSCIRKYASDGAVIAWFNQTYGTHLRSPIIELMTVGNAGDMFDTRGEAQSAPEVELFAQFILGVLWPRFQLQMNRSAPWVSLASALVRRREWARKARPAR